MTESAADMTTMSMNITTMMESAADMTTMSMSITTMTESAVDMTMITSMTIIITMESVAVDITMKDIIMQMRYLQAGEQRHLISMIKQRLMIFLIHLLTQMNLAGY